MSDNDTTNATEKTIAAEDGPIKLKDLLKLAGSPSLFFNSINRLEYPIRTKLMTITSGIIIISLFVAIYIAINTFQKDTETRIYTSNTQTAKLLAEKLETGIETRISEVKFIFNLIEAQKSNRNTVINSLKRQFLNQESEILYVASYNGSVTDRDTLVDLDMDLYQPAILKQNNLNLNQIRKNNLSMREELTLSFLGATVIKNISPYYGTPLILILAPEIKGPSQPINQVRGIILKMDSFLSAVNLGGVTQAMVLDGKGNVVSHKDNNLVLSETNLSDKSEVKRIMEEKNANGTFQYTDDQNEGQFAAFQRTKNGGLYVITQVPVKTALEAINIIQIRSLLITLLVLILAITIIYFFAKSLSEPLKRLVEASNEIKAGNYHQEIEATTHDEIGHLTHSFKSMSQGLEEREKLKGALNKFVNPEIARQALEGEIQLGGERKQATIFFSDIRSFTKISESLEPEEVVEFLNEYMTLMVKCINDTNGVVDKYIGDAIMAVWGTPVSTGNDEENAINGCLMMREALIKFNEGRGGPKKPIIKIGSGLNSGPVLAGQIGSEDRLEYTVIGDAVNLASRIEALNKPFGTDILISQETHSRVENIFSCVPMQKIKVKGKSEPQQIYAVLGRKDDPTAPKDIEEMRKRVGIDFTPPPSGKTAAPDEEEVKYEILE